MASNGSRMWRTPNNSSAIQSIPSLEAELFKRWLAKVGYERLKEIENPELGTARIREFYKAKGDNDEWIEKRVCGIANRDDAWLLPLQRLYNHGLPLEDALTND